MTGDSAIPFTLLLPLSAMVSTLLFSHRPNLREMFSVGFGLALVGTACQLANVTFAGQRPTWTLATPIPGSLGEAFPLAFQAEPLGAVFALVASVLWVVTTCYAIGYMRGHQEDNQTRFFACFAVAIFAAMGAAMAANLFTLFVFYEIMTLSTYPLVTHHGNEAAKQGGRMYLGTLLTTSIALLMLALVWTWYVAGTLDFRPGGVLATGFDEGRITASQLALLLGLFAFGTGKAALMPVHKWLPAAMVAPTPVSALLHAVAVVKVGVFTILKVAIYIFGLDLLNQTMSNVWLMYWASGTILLASLIAMTKDNLKARLAYSTISQLSYIVLAAALATPTALIGGGMHIVMHAFGKITLFFCAGAIYVAAHKTKISQLRGIGYRMPITMSAFLVGSLSIIGVPPLGGSWSKWCLALGAAETEHPWLMAVLMISSLLNVAYLLPIAIVAFQPPADQDAKQEFAEAPWFCVVPLCVTAISSVALFFFAHDIYQALAPIVEV